MKGYLKGLALVYITIGAATAVRGLAQLAGGQHTEFLTIGAGSLSLLAAVAVYLLAEIAQNTTQPMKPEEPHR